MKLTKKFSLVLLTLVSGLMLFTVSSVNAASSDSSTSTGSVGFYGTYNPPADNPGSDNGNNDDGNGDVIVTPPSSNSAHVGSGTRLPQTGETSTIFLTMLGLMVISSTGYILIKNKKRGF